MDSGSEDSRLPPAWSVALFTFSIEDTDSELVVECNHQRFIITLSADNFSQSTSLRDRYLFFLEVAENFELDGYTVEDFYDWIVDPLLPIFTELPEKDPDSTLQDFLFPETHAFTVKADGETMVAVPCDGKETATPLFGIYLPDDICKLWSLFKPSEIQIWKEITTFGPPSNTPKRVLLKDGTVAFIKLMRRGDKHFLLRELETYGKIRDAHFPNSLRISRLLGLVRDEDDQVSGLILTYIDCEHKTLHCAAKPETPKDLRQQWTTQVHEIVHHLHDAGVVWGDAKPDNVLIDRNNDAWLIDFGGGYTEGWVPKELSGSVEGDLKALEKIKEFLG